MRLRRVAVLAAIVSVSLCVAALRSAMQTVPSGHPAETHASARLTSAQVGRASGATPPGRARAVTMTTELRASRIDASATPDARPEARRVARASRGFFEAVRVAAPANVVAPTSASAPPATPSDEAERAPEVASDLASLELDLALAELRNDKPLVLDLYRERKDVMRRLYDVAMSEISETQ